MNTEHFYTKKRRYLKIEFDTFQITLSTIGKKEKMKVIKICTK